MLLSPAFLPPLLGWYERNKRDLPWRRDREPYHVWLSEIMLQQTRVEAVKGYYARFLAELPHIPSLAAMRRMGYAPEQTCVLGDRIYTDIACGVNAGIDTIFVLSGEGVMTDIEKYHVQPTYCMQNIREVLNTLQKGEEK